MKRFCLSLILSAFILSCGRAELEETVATVNGAPVLLKDFKKELKAAQRRSPGLELTDESAAEALSVMIDRKLLVQEAVKLGLSVDPHFIETIKSHWEQTLLRELVNAKTRQWGDTVTATEEEVERHYARLRFSITIRSVKAAGEKEIEEIKESMRRGRRIPGEVIDGPLYAENFSPDSPLSSVFDLDRGAITVIKDIEGITIVQVLKKEPAKIQPLKEIRDRVRQYLIEFKRQKAMDDWLRGIKKTSTIKIDKDAIKKSRKAD